MKQEDRQLLLKDLCTRLPFGICANLPNHHLVSHKYVIDDINTHNGWTNGLLDCAGRIQIYGAKIEDIKPYLRPMSSMTEEEKEEYKKACDLDTKILSNHPMDGTTPFPVLYNSQDYLNSIHVDYRGLIPKGLAIEVTKENNPYEEINL